MICRNCGAGLEADRIDTSLGVVTCSHCGSLHDIPNTGPDKSAEGVNPGTRALARKPERVEVALPDKFKLRRGTGSLEVIWPVGGIFPGLVLSIVAGAFTYVSVTSELWFLLFVGVGLFYFAALQAFNQHRIRVDKARLEVTQGPLPSLGSQKINASDVVQLYATEHKSNTKSDKHGKQGEHRSANTRKHYRLSAKTRNNSSVKILGGLGDPLQALWLEQEIESLLGIVDEQVTGEHLP